MSGGRNRARIRRGLHRLGIAQLRAFVWERGRVGFVQNLEGMRSVVHAGFFLTAAAWSWDALALWVFGMEGLLVLLLIQGIWIAAATGLVLLNIGFLSTLDGQPVGRFGAANMLSLGRLASLPLLCSFIVQERWVAALVAYLVIASSDIVDGIVARRRHEETRLGFVLDPIVDVLFQVSVFVSLYSGGRIGGVTLAAVLFRYGLLFFGCAALYFLQGRIWIRPTPFGRATGVALGAGTILLLYGPRSGWPDATLSLIARIITLLFLAGAVHVLAIGWMNFRRPAAQGYGDWRRWGLRIARPGSSAENLDRAPRKEDEDRGS